jgi:hypothetical protein
MPKLEVQPPKGSKSAFFILFSEFRSKNPHLKPIPDAALAAAATWKTLNSEQLAVRGLLRII